MYLHNNGFKLKIKLHISANSVLNMYFSGKHQLEIEFTDINKRKITLAIN